MSKDTALEMAFQQSLDSAFVASHSRQFEQAWYNLERAHLIGQTRLTWHWHVHCRMLGLAWLQSNAKEVIGQLLRFALVPLGHLLGHLPIGNIGSTKVGVFASASVPDDIATLLAENARKQK